MAEKKDVRIQLVMTPSELDALDEWRARKRIWSRSEAIRDAVRRLVESDRDAPSDAAGAPLPPADPKPAAPKKEPAANGRWSGLKQR